LFGLLSAVGQCIILYAIKAFNSLAVTTITTTRKFFTILASVLIYGHSLAPLQWTGVALVFAGLGTEVWEKYEKYRSASHHGHAHAHAVTPSSKSKTIGALGGIGTIVKEKSEKQK